MPKDCKQTLTVERLKEVLSYDRETGFFTRLQDGRGNVKIGDKAGRITTNGRRQIGIDYRRYTAARLAWLYVTGKWPENEIDHKNCDGLDDRFINLREATRLQNMGNVRRLKNNTSGIKGVSWHKGSRRWHARISDGVSTLFLGQFVSKQDAAAAYAHAAITMRGEFARLG